MTVDAPQDQLAQLFAQGVCGPRRLPVPRLRAEPAVHEQHTHGPTIFRWRAVWASPTTPEICHVLTEMPHFCYGLDHIGPGSPEAVRRAGARSRPDRRDPSVQVPAALAHALGRLI